MLPDFPSLKKILDDVATLRIDAATREKWPILNSVRAITAHEGSEYQFRQKGFGTIVHAHETHQARFEIILTLALSARCQPHQGVKDAQIRLGTVAYRDCQCTSSAFRGESTMAMSRNSPE